MTIQNLVSGVNTQHTVTRLISKKAASSKVSSLEGLLIDISTPSDLFILSCDRAQSYGLLK